MFKLFFLFAILVSVNASYLAAPAVHVQPVALKAIKTVAVPTVVGHTEKVVGEQVVGYNTHHNVHHVPKTISQAHHIVKPATWQSSSGHSIPATGAVHVQPIVHAAPVLHAAPLAYGAPLGHGLGAY